MMECRLCIDTYVGVIKRFETVLIINTLIKRFETVPIIRFYLLVTRKREVDYRYRDINISLSQQPAIHFQKGNQGSNRKNEMPNRLSPLISKFIEWLVPRFRGQANYSKALLSLAAVPPCRRTGAHGDPAPKGSSVFVPQ